MYKILFIVFILNSFILSAQGIGVGKRIDMTDKLGLDKNSGQFAQIFVPDYFSVSQDGKFLLVFHIHSASWAAEDEVYKSNTNAVLFNIHLGGFSSSYQNYFSNQDNFQKILDLVVNELGANDIIDDPQLESLIITSFSAGYGGVREVLKTQNYYDKIDALTLADGLHSNLEANLMKEQMKDFLRFANDASDKKKIMLLTHSSILTYTYANTTETADYLINNINSVRANYNAVDEIGTQYSKADTGYFHVKGYRGNTADDHMKHLYNMHLMLKHAVDIMSIPTSVDEVEKKQNYGYKLMQNYPNPFNPSTKIKYQIPGQSLPEGSRARNDNTSVTLSGVEEFCVTLKVYDILGREVATIVNEEKAAGEYEVKFYGGSLSSGFYFYQLSAGNYFETKKMMLLN